MGENGVTMRTKYKSTSGSDNQKEFYYCQQHAKGAYWVKLPDSHLIEMDTVKAMCHMTGKTKHQAPAKWVSGAPTKEVANRLAGHCFDKSFLSKLDAVSGTKAGTLFKCGTCWEMCHEESNG